VPMLLASIEGLIGMGVCLWLRPLTSLDGLVPGCRARVDRDPVRLRQLAGAATTATPIIKRQCG
jgi:hypothetical protein